MARVPQKEAETGSQKWLQLLVNERPELIDGRLAAAIGLPAGGRIQWLSPLRQDEYAEYANQAFLDRLGVERLQRPLKEFWPRGGPQWDGLGRTVWGDLILVEAKAHVRELLSSVNAVSPRTRTRFLQSLSEVQEYIHAEPGHFWHSTFYQHANRLAHLHFLRKVNRRRAWLVQVCFVGDTEMRGPETREEWLGAIRLRDMLLGTSRNRLKPYVIDIFVDVRDLG